MVSRLKSFPITAFKQALDLNPWEEAVNPMSSAEITSDYLSLIYWGDLRKTDLLIEAEASSNLVDWSSADVTETVIDREEDIETVEARVSIEGEGAGLEDFNSF